LGKGSKGGNGACGNEAVDSQMALARIEGRYKRELIERDNIEMNIER
jgi:hypothetical protein